MTSTIMSIEEARKPYTREEIERGRAALAAADELRAEIRKRRKGRPLPDSAAVIRAARDERSRRL